MSHCQLIDPDRPWLAPLSGYSDLAFRLLCREFGAAVCCSEMVSAKGLIHNSSGTKILLKTCPADNPLIIQLFGAEAQIMERAVAEIMDMGFTWFDLNAGCPAPKVTRNGGGAAMLKDTENVLKVARHMVKRAGHRKVGVKIRLGWDKPVHLDLARQLADIGVGWITLHPRLGVQGFRGEAAHTEIKALCDVVDVPIIASGDLMNADTSRECMEFTGADGLMFARGALANPAIFDDYLKLTNKHSPAKAHQASPPDLPRLGRIIRRHIELARDYGQPNTVMVMRSFIPRYVKHHSMAKAIRRELVEQQTWDGMLEIIDRYLPAPRVF